MGGLLIGDLNFTKKSVLKEKGFKSDAFLLKPFKNKIPALCYSPTVKYAVPSPLTALTNVFGKGTCVSLSPKAPEKKSRKLNYHYIIAFLQASQVEIIFSKLFEISNKLEKRWLSLTAN